MKHDTKKELSGFFQRTFSSGWARRLLFIYIIVAILSPILANREPLFFKQKNNSSFPALSFGPYVSILDENNQLIQIRKVNVDWKNIPADVKIFAPVTYDPSETDFDNRDFVSPFGQQNFKDGKGQTTTLPFRYRHWLGTSKTGTDLLSGLIHGTRISLLIGFGSMLIASLIGFIFGSMAGYLGDYSVRVPKWTSWGIILMIVPAWFYSQKLFPTGTDGFTFFILFPRTIMFLVLLFLPVIIWKFSNTSIQKRDQSFIPVDSIISRIIELFVSLPRLVLIITLAALSRPSILNIILIIGFTSWTEIARIVRAEILRIRSVDFVESSRALGFPFARIIYSSIFPNIIGPVGVVIIFGVAGAILMEAGLSFLGIGLPVNAVSWGTLLNECRKNFSAWWLVLFPGLTLSTLILVFNRTGELLRERMHSEKRNIS